MFIVTACDIPVRLGLGYLFNRVILAPVLEHVRAASGDPPQTVVDRARLSAIPVPSAALDALEAAVALPEGAFVPVAASRIVDLVNQGASASVLATDGSTLLHLLCRRFANATPAQLARLAAAHPAQRVAIDDRGRTPLHCLVSFAAELTPEVLMPLIGDSGAVAVADADGRTPLNAACADRATVRPDVLALLVAAHPAARNKRDATGSTPLDYALARDVTLGPASISLLASGGDGDGKARPGAPRITLVVAHGSEVWLSLSPSTGGYADSRGARMLWYEIETIPLTPVCDGGASFPDDVPTRTVSAHRPAPRVAIDGLINGAPYAFRARAVGLAGPGAWCRADTSGHPDDARTSSRPAPDATHRRNAAVLVDDATATDERAVTPSVYRPTEDAAHSLFGDVSSGGGLVIHRALAKVLRSKRTALGFANEVRWRA
jgi:hypothetical protein